MTTDEHRHPAQDLSRLAGSDDRTNASGPVRQRDRIHDQVAARGMHTSSGAVGRTRWSTGSLSRESSPSGGLRASPRDPAAWEFRQYPAGGQLASSAGRSVCRAEHGGLRAALRPGGRCAGSTCDSGASSSSGSQLGLSRRTIDSDASEAPPGRLSRWPARSASTRAGARHSTNSNGAASAKASVKLSRSVR